MLITRVDRWIVGFEKKHGVLPEDALYRFVLRRPIRTILIVGGAVSGFPFLFGLMLGLLIGHLL